MVSDYSPEEMLQDIEDGNRKPFTRILRDFVSKWTDEGLEEFARKYPDRYLQGLSIAAKAAGYKEQLALDVTMQAKVRELSDAELLRALADLQTRISALQPLEQRSIPASTTDPA